MTKRTLKAKAGNSKAKVQRNRAACAPAKSKAGRTTKANSKQSRLIAMMSGPEGATIEAMMKESGWQQHSVRGFLAGVVRKRLKFNLQSEKIEGNRVYRIFSSGASGGPRGGKVEG